MTSFADASAVVLEGESVAFWTAALTLVTAVVTIFGPGLASLIFKDKDPSQKLTTTLVKSVTKQLSSTNELLRTDLSRIRASQEASAAILEKIHKKVR